MDQLPAGFLNNASRSDYAHASYFVEVPSGDVKLAEIFTPRFWAHHTRTLRKYDLLRIRADDGAFDFMLSVAEVRPGGVRVESWPKLPDGVAAVEAVGVQAVEKNGQMCPRIEFRKATKWRVIGHDNNEYAAGFEDKRAAATAMVKYMSEIGFTPEGVSDHMHSLGIASLMG